jgi:hypothetical protein
MKHSACPTAVLQEPGRPIRYPSKIAPALSDLMLSVDGVMSGLRQMLADHMDSAVKRLRVQVRCQGTADPAASGNIEMPTSAAAMVGLSTT